MSRASNKKLPIPVERRISLGVAINVLSNGTYQHELRVFCDYCGTRNLRESIADGNLDVCLRCAKQISSSTSIHLSDEPTVFNLQPQD